VAKKAPKKSMSDKKAEAAAAAGPIPLSALPAKKRTVRYLRKATKGEVNELFAAGGLGEAPRTLRDARSALIGACGLASDRTSTAQKDIPIEIEAGDTTPCLPRHETPLCSATETASSMSIGDLQLQIAELQGSLKGLVGVVSGLVSQVKQAQVVPATTKRTRDPQEAENGGLVGGDGDRPGPKVGKVTTASSGHTITVNIYNL
jgi:hypothetical protein